MFDKSTIVAKPLPFDIPNMSKPPETPPDNRVYTSLMALKPPGLSLNAWAQRAGVGRSIFADIRRHGNPTSETLDKLLHVAGVSFVQFDAGLHPVQSEVRGAGAVGLAEISRAFRGEQPSRDLPLYGSAVGGEYGDVDEHIELTELHLNEVLEWLARPARLVGDKDAYALTIVGDSMAPRFKPGECVAVSPRASIGIGDDVIVQLRNGVDDVVRMVLIKELVRRGSDYVDLKQHNPDQTFRIPWARVSAMHKVGGHYL
jgi:hypothetical protein